MHCIYIIYISPILFIVANVDMLLLYLNSNVSLFISVKPLYNVKDLPQENISNDI